MTITADSTTDGSGGAVWPFAALGVIVALVLAPFAAVLLWKRRRRARRRANPDPRGAIIGAWHELVDTLADHRIATSRSETPYELAARIPEDAGDAARPALQSLADVYTHARYATEPPRQGGVDVAWRDVDEVRRVLDARQGLWRRVRSRLSPRTLGRDRSDELV